MIKRIFIRSLLVSIVSIIIFSLCTSLLMYNIDKYNQKNTLSVYLNSISTFADLSVDYQLSADQIAFLYGDDLRITLIDYDGMVLADSEVSSEDMENHKQREEIKNALLIGDGSSVRYSSTLKKNVLYVAKRIDKYKIVIRAMIPLSTLASNLFSLLPYILLSASIAFIISMIFAGRLAKATLQPLLNIDESIMRMRHEDFNIKIPYSKYDEINSLINSVNLLSNEISTSMSLQQNERDKLSFILNNISQGVILIDKFYGIIHCNRSALNIFNTDDNSLNTLFQLTRNNSIINATENALNNKVSKFDLTIRETGEIYVVTVMPLSAKNYENTVLILLTDVTQARNNETIRKEFFSNASHELRTPVTSIMGFSELIKDDNNLRTIKDYAAIINKESKKLTDILDGIMMISSLEEHPNSKMNETIDIGEVLPEIIKEIQPLSAERNITFHLNLDKDTFIKMDKNDFSSVITNLIENGIKYGKENGNIWINTEKVDDSIYLKIRDDGMGISKTDLPRVFERFYRTEKSRSTKVKGSGIGLSIVKHIIMKYSAEIDVESTENSGTTFTIKFNSLKI